MTCPFVLAADLVRAEFPVVLLVIAFIAIAVIAIIFGHIAEKKRREALRVFADRLGLRFLPDKVSDFDEDYPAFDCLDQGHSRYAYNRMRGEVEGRWCLCFDYHYATTSTDSKGRSHTTHHHFSGILIDSGLALEPLFIRNENFGDKITEFFGADDIDFESHEFSRKFYVKSPNRRFAYDMLSQDTMEHLLESPRFRIQMAGPLVMAWRSRRFRAPQFQQALDLVVGILDRIPKDLQEQMRE